MTISDSQTVRLSNNGPEKYSPKWNYEEQNEMLYCTALLMLIQAVFVLYTSPKLREIISEKAIRKKNKKYISSVLLLTLSLSLSCSPLSDD